VADDRPDVLAAVAAKRGANPADSVAELLASGIDGVVVSAATPAHAEPIAATAAESAKPQNDDRLTINTPEGTPVERLGTRPSYTYQLEAFAAHVRHGAPLPLDTADAVENMAYIDAAYRAAGMSPR
jgi:predicted dehydrogenase